MIRKEKIYLVSLIFIIIILLPLIKTILIFKEGVTIAKLFYGFVMLIVSFKYLTRKIPLPIYKINIYIFLFFCWALFRFLITYVEYFNPEKSLAIEKAYFLNENLSFLMIILLSALIIFYVDLLNSNELENVCKNILKLLPIGILIVMIYTIYFNHRVSDWFGINRASIIRSDPNELSCIMSSLSSIYIFNILVRGKNIKISIINIAGIILNLYIISFITISKSGFIIYLLSFVIYFFFSYKLNDKKNINKFIYTIVILLIFFILIQFNIINLNYLKMRYFGYDINRFNDPLLYITSGRSNTWLSGIIGFLKRPIMGVGSSDLIEMDFLMRINATYSVSHNLYISLLVQYGIIGFFIFSAIIYETFKDINLYIKYNLFLLVPVIILILLLLSGLSLSWVKREIVWIFIGIVNGMKFKTKKII